MGQRQYKPFDIFHRLPSNVLAEIGLEVIYSLPKNKQLIYKNNQGQWATWEEESLLPTIDIELELVIKNSGEQEIWHRIELQDMIVLDEMHWYQFQDFSLDRQCYSYHGSDLKTTRLFVKLQPGQKHHFLVYRHHNALSFPEMA